MARKKKNKDRNNRDVMEEAFILKHQRGWSTGDIARHLGVSPRSVQRYLELYEDKASRYWTGELNRRAREPRYGEHVRARVIELRRELATRSAATIHRTLVDEFGKECPSLPTVCRILRDAGLTREKRPRDKDYISFEREFPNDLWQVDFKGWDLVGHLGKLHLLAFMDDCSRFIVGARWYTTDRAENVMYLLRDALDGHGVPNQVLSDNGAQFKTVLGDVNTTKYYRFLVTIGVEPIFHRPRHPESKGKLERWFAFVDNAFMPDARLLVQQHPELGLQEFNAYFQKHWLDWYNYRHQHSSLDRQPPGKVYLEHPRRKDVPLSVDVDWDAWTGRHEIRKVDKQGHVSVDGRQYTLPAGLSGRKIDVRRLPGRIEVVYQDRPVETFIVPSEAGDGTRLERTRKINKDGYLKFSKRSFKLGTAHALKTVRVVVSQDGKEILVYEGDILIARIKITEGKPY